MPERAIKNLPASVRQRLANIADDSNVPFQDMLQQYAMERFLYRLADALFTFLLPLVRAARANMVFQQQWDPGGDWQPL